MDEIRKLTMEDCAELRRITIDSFMNNDYFIDLFPDEERRAAQIDRHLFVLCEYCIMAGGSYGYIHDGRLCAGQFIVRYGGSNADEIDPIFFDAAIKYGDEPKRLFKEALKRRVTENGKSVEYFLLGVVDKKMRGRGIGVKLISHCVHELRGETIMTELTSPEIITFFEKFSEERKIIKEEVSESFVITTLLPEKE